MTLMSKIGEKEFLKNLISGLPQHKNFVNGFGHDISLLDIGLPEYLAFKIDRAPSSVAVKHGWAGFEVFGRLAVIANISDMFSSGASAKGFMVSIVTPRSTEDSQVAAITMGCVGACEEYGLAFLGGDTKEGGCLQVVGACIGTSPKSHLHSQRKAQPGDFLVVAGSLGKFLAAYELLVDSEKNKRDIDQDLLRILTHPQTPAAECEYITKGAYSVASCDLSDGLADALNYFCSENIGICIEEQLLPTHPLTNRLKDKFEIYKLAFGAGDWAAAFVVPEDRIDSLLQEKPKELEIAAIGRFENNGKRTIRRLNGYVEATPININEHFIERLEDEGSYLEHFRK